MHVMKHVNTEYQNEKLSLSENKMIILEYLILSMHMKTYCRIAEDFLVYMRQCEITVIIYRRFSWH